MDIIFVIRRLTDDLSDAALQSQPREVISQAGAYLLGALAVLSTPSPGPYKDNFHVLEQFKISNLGTRVTVASF